jgi:hypothetical protein
LAIFKRYLNNLFWICILFLSINILIHYFPILRLYFLFAKYFQIPIDVKTICLDHHFLAIW